jgi:hypothetical protein
MVGFDSTVALADRLSQTDRVRNIDVTAAVTDNSSLLPRMATMEIALRCTPISRARDSCVSEASRIPG